MKKRSMNRIKSIVIKGCIPAFLILSLVCGLNYKPAAQAASDRAKKAAGIIVGAAIGGGLAGGLGSGKWVPLGLFGGGLTGGLIARGATKDSYEKLKRKKEKLEKKLQSTTNERKKHKFTEQLSSVNQKLQARG